MKTAIPLLSTALTLALMAPVHAADSTNFRLVIKDHRFVPATLVIPANKKIKLVIENLDPTPEEFESHQLNREKIVPANGKTSLYLGPLEPGSYPIVGEFNPKTASGTILAR